MEGIPASERTVWESPLSGNAPVAAAVVVLSVLGNKWLGHLVSGSAAETTVLAHDKRVKLLGVVKSGHRDRTELLRVVRDQVPPYAQACMRQGIDAF